MFKTYENLSKRVYGTICNNCRLSARHILEPEAWSKFDVTQRMRKLKSKINFKIVHRYLMICVKMVEGLLV